jgi:hypothetical protein
VSVRRSPTRAAALIAAAIACATAAGCGVDDEPKSPTKRAPSSAKARCAGAECRVRVVCKGKVHVRVGPAPVSIRTNKTALRTNVLADFAGSSHDAVVRC